MNYTSGGSRDYLPPAAYSRLAMKINIACGSSVFLWRKNFTWKETSFENIDVESFTPGWKSSASSSTKRFALQPYLSARFERSWDFACFTGKGSERAFYQPNIKQPWSEQSYYPHWSDRKLWRWAVSASFGTGKSDRKWPRLVQFFKRVRTALMIALTLTISRHYSRTISLLLYIDTTIMKFECVRFCSEIQT